MPTDADFERMYERIDQAIDSSGRMIIGVPDADPIPFAYTIGNHLKGLPEILVIGIGMNDILNVWSEIMIKRKEAFKDGELVDIGGKYPCLAVHADQRAKDEYLIQATQYLETEDYSVIQFILPNPEGMLFSDDGPYAQIPCLSPRYDELKTLHSNVQLMPRAQGYFPPEAD